MSETHSRSSAGPRDRLVRSAAQLIRRQGVSGTGMREIVADARAPWGSLSHYFPRGKEQLVSEAVTMMGGVAARRVTGALAGLEVRRPSALLEAIVEDWRQDLSRESFTAGCPLVAAAADTASRSAPLRQAIAGAFRDWEAPLSEGLIVLGVPQERAPGLSLLVLSALEGAIILARVRHDLNPLDTLVTELGPHLDSARKGRARR